MAKKLEEFVVKVNIDGWYIKGLGGLPIGAELKGSEILPRVVQALADGETYPKGETRVPVCFLYGGSVDELKETTGYKPPVKKAYTYEDKAKPRLVERKPRPRIEPPPAKTESKPDEPKAEPVTREQQKA